MGLRLRVPLRGVGAGILENLTGASRNPEGILKFSIHSYLGLTDVMSGFDVSSVGVSGDGT